MLSGWLSEREGTLKLFVVNQRPATMSMMQTRLFASSLPNQVSDMRRVEPPGIAASLPSTPDAVLLYVITADHA